MPTSFFDYIFRVVDVAQCIFSMAYAITRCSSYVRWSLWRAHLDQNLHVGLKHQNQSRDHQKRKVHFQSEEDLQVMPPL